MIYFVKQICTILLVTAGGLMALLMQPNELLGDRCAQILVSVLIIITTLQTDLGLGSLSYLIWVDWFNLMQLSVLLIALAQTMVVHRLDHNKMGGVLVFFDRVSRIVIPLLLYPACVIGMIALGFGWTATGAAVIFGGISVSIAVSAVWVRVGYIGAKTERRKAVLKAQQLIASGASEKAAIDVVEELFHKYDLDRSGEVSCREMRELIKALHPEAPRAGIMDAMKEVAEIAGDDDTLDLPAFIDAYHVSNRMLAAFEGEARATRAAEAGADEGSSALAAATTASPAAATPAAKSGAPATAEGATGDEALHA